MARPISRDELRTLMDRGAVTVVETLPLQYYEQGHLPGALHLGNEHVAGIAPRLLPNKDATIVTYCASTTCQNSAQAARALETAGYTDVREYIEGKADWESAGLPLETGVTATV